MATPTDDPARAPAFPSWPFNCLTLYAQIARDFGRYAQTVTKSTDVVETARAEGDLGVSLWSDLMKGYYDLALAPYKAMAAAMAAQVAPDSAPTVSVTPPRTAKRPRKAKAAKPAV